VIKVGFSVAGAAGALGVIAGVVALNKRSQLNQACNSNHECDAAYGGAGDLATAYSWAAVSTVSFAVAGAGLVVAVAALLSGDHSGAPPQGGSPLTPWIGPGAAGIHGRF
jgi:hypothetical protein